VKPFVSKYLHSILKAALLRSNKWKAITTNKTGRKKFKEIVEQKTTLQKT
jgi:hypothetical protein